MECETYLVGDKGHIGVQICLLTRYLLDQALYYTRSDAVLNVFCLEILCLIKNSVDVKYYKEWFWDKCFLLDSVFKMNTNLVYTLNIIVLYCAIDVDMLCSKMCSVCLRTRLDTGPQHLSAPCSSCNGILNIILISNISRRNGATIQPI